MENEKINLIINFKNEVKSNFILKNLLPNYNDRKFHYEKDNEIVLSGNICNMSYKHLEDSNYIQLNMELSINYNNKKLDFDLWLMGLQNKTQNCCINKLAGKIKKIDIIHNGVSMCMCNK